jgi:anti-sigma factor RsiW
VNCDELKNLLHGYLDQELDLVRSLEIEHHLQECAHCAEAWQQHLRLRQLLCQPALYHRAAPDLRQRILSSLSQPHAGPATQPARHRRPRFPTAALGMAASLAFVALLTWTIARHSSADGEDVLVRDVVTAHVRSQLLDRPPDVASADTHTVKPWFQGKVDFAPPVRDLAEQGYPLSGGRLDYLDNRNVAALVYQRRKHVINLFLWPAPDRGDTALHTLTRQGYQLLHWTQGGFTYWAISDLNERELRAFAELIQR